MKTAIVFYSKHHGNTKKLVEAIERCGGVELIDASECESAELSGYDLIGFASGIYYSGFHKKVLNIARRSLPQGSKVFFIYSCGVRRKGYKASMEKAVAEKASEVLGSYGCLGHDSFGPLRLAGGMAKGHPDAEEISGAVEFYKSIIESLQP